VGEDPVQRALFISISRASAGSAGKSPVEILPDQFISSNFTISFQQIKDLVFSHLYLQCHSHPTALAN
jgi:hypothetical protein